MRINKLRIVPLNRVPPHDLIGPSDPISNLRPQFYAPLFPELHQTSIPSPTLHPYSLAEFPLLHKHTDPTQNLLQEYQQLLHRQDIEYRLQRYRLDNFNQTFWSNTNTSFLLAREEYLRSHPSPQDLEIDLSPFYAQHLKQTKFLYQQYNSQLWGLTAKSLWPAFKAALRPYRWAYKKWRLS